jgi:hypothetical protein
MHPGQVTFGAKLLTEESSCSSTPNSEKRNRQPRGSRFTRPHMHIQRGQKDLIGSVEYQEGIENKTAITDDR